MRRARAIARARRNFGEAHGLGRYATLNLYADHLHSRAEALERSAYCGNLRRARGTDENATKLEKWRGL
jgi:hypothetical protein